MLFCFSVSPSFVSLVAGFLSLGEAFGCQHRIYQLPPPLIKSELFDTTSVSSQVGAICSRLHCHILTLYFLPSMFS